MEPIIIEARSIEEAKKKAAEQLGVTEDKVQVEVIQEAASGLLSRFSRAGRIKIKAWVEEEAPEQDLVQEDEDLGSEESDLSAEPAYLGEPVTDEDPWDPGCVLQHICRAIVPDAVVYKREEGDQIVYYIKGDGSGIFIGRKGQTLNAFQFIVSRIVAKRKGEEPAPFSVDSEGYRERRARMLRELAHKLADRAIQTGRSQSTELLNAYERRIVHTALRDRTNIITKSYGNGDVKRVQIETMRHDRDDEEDRY